MQLAGQHGPVPAGELVRAVRSVVAAVVGRARRRTQKLALTSHPRTSMRTKLEKNAFLLCVISTDVNWHLPTWPVHNCLFPLYSPLITDMFTLFYFLISIRRNVGQRTSLLLSFF